jgi:aminoglycoside phosphotransferase (APT) family kinase protein
VLVFAAEVMAPLGLRLPREVSEALQELPRQTLDATTCRLHGDFAPVNILVDAQGHAVGIDVTLARAGYPEVDLARFLTMLDTERWFIATQSIPSARRLRHRAESTLLEAYYGREGWSPLLEVRLIDALARRWVRREATRQSNQPALASVRARMVDAHFQTLLVEVARRLERLL